MSYSRIHSGIDSWTVQAVSNFEMGFFKIDLVLCFHVSGFLKTSPEPIRDNFFGIQPKGDRLAF